MNADILPCLLKKHNGLALLKQKFDHSSVAQTQQLVAY